MSKGKSENQRKRERKALELFESGIATKDIGERFGVCRPSVNRMIFEARKERQADAQKPQQNSEENTA